MYVGGWNSSRTYWKYSIVSLPDFGLCTDGKESSAENFLYSFVSLKPIFSGVKFA